MARLIVLIIIALTVTGTPAQAAPADPWPWPCWPEDWFSLSAVMDGAQQLTVTVRNVSDITTPVSRLAFWGDNTEGVLFYEGYVDLVAMRPGEYVSFPVRIDIYQPGGEIRGWYEWQGYGPSCPTHRILFHRVWFPCAAFNSAAHCDGRPTEGE